MGGPPARPAAPRAPGRRWGRAAAATGHAPAPAQRRPPPAQRVGGSRCAAAAECCAHNCNQSGLCALGGSIGDSPCKTALECVTEFCTAGHCNREAPACPSGPGTCENCLAINCCDLEAL